MAIPTGPIGSLRVAALLVGLTLCSATAAGASTVVQFRTPSGNIGCAYSSGLPGDEAPTVRCDIRSRLRPAPRQPRSCPLDYGDSIEISRTGAARLVCHGDTAIDPGSRILAYGRTFQRGGLSCLSRSVGLRCANRNGHGFFLSRESWRTF